MNREDDEIEESPEQEEQAYYDVEKVYDVRMYSKTPQVRIKWTGFDRPEDDTWEPYKNLNEGTCLYFMREYREFLKKTEKGEVLKNKLKLTKKIIELWKKEMRKKGLPFNDSNEQSRIIASSEFEDKPSTPQQDKSVFIPPLPEKVNMLPTTHTHNFFDPVIPLKQQLEVNKPIQTTDVRQRLDDKPKLPSRDSTKITPQRPGFSKIEDEDEDFKIKRKTNLNVNKNMDGPRPPPPAIPKPKTPNEKFIPKPQTNQSEIRFDKKNEKISHSFTSESSTKKNKKWEKAKAYLQQHNSQINPTQSTSNKEAEKWTRQDKFQMPKPLSSSKDTKKTWNKHLEAFYNDPIRNTSRRDLDQRLKQNLEITTIDEIEVISLFPDHLKKFGVLLSKKKKEPIDKDKPPPVKCYLEDYLNISPRDAIHQLVKTIESNIDIVLSYKDICEGIIPNPR